ncbi:heat shock 70 kDa protein 12B isoform X1 [Alligator mississippiensis]|uniref:heat shock 70 kDa protein 12B isoform X1 n=2 Tax=Alligator mississippiensis TaxID=8496 RepID=UPI002877A23A|nr:heat shock 70 kDa protein 12B isoform X1 [Alligator mississippiensis]
MADKSLFITAIDFGTSYSGYCFALESCVDQICQVFWGMEHGFKTVKTPTCILFNEKKEFKKFGYDAVMKYNTLPSSEAPKWYFFQNFKMKLYNQKITSNMELEADNGRTLPALTVFSESLCYMKDHALKTIGEASFQTACEPEDVTWVVTVPAIWDASARQFMRLAAKEAGLITDMFSEKLIIVLEPEAASVWCKQLPQYGFVAEGSYREKFEESPGTQYIVVDCGGGTIDITVHEIQQSKTLKELHKASGGGWGGNTVDENFKDFLRGIFYGGIWDEYIKKYPTEFHQMMYNFGLQKCSSSRDDVYLHCYSNLIRVAEQKQDISLFFNGVEGTHWHDGIIMITYEKMKSFFAYSTGKIIGALKEILRKPEMATIQYILLVGGFASSIILRDEIYHTFSERYSILCPMEAQAAIVKGAVLFGHNSQIAVSRISARTYGVAVSRAFDAAVHDERKKRVSQINNYVYCTDLFMKLVGIGDLVKIDEAAHYTFTPVEPDQTRMCIQFYCTEKEDAKYIDEEGMKMLGSCTVPMPNPELGRKRQVRLDVKFGLTE